MLSRVATGVKWLVSAANNVHVRPLLPSFITSTDESILFVLKGKSNKSSGWYLLSKKDTGKKSGKQSVCSNSISGTDHLNGLRVRLTVTINALGLIAAPFIYVIGITREELPLDKNP